MSEKCLVILYGRHHTSFVKGKEGECSFLPFTRSTLLVSSRMCEIRLRDQSAIITTFLLLVLLLQSITMSIAVPLSLDESGDALLRLKQSFANSSMLSSWNPLQPPCVGDVNNWVGLICSKGGSVFGIRLENMGLSGAIDVDALLALPRLRSVSLMDNEFGGSMPNVTGLRALRAIWLSNNKFEGPIDPFAFEGLNKLRKVHLANNKFIGEIPISLAQLPKLLELRLEGNQFQGLIPDFRHSYFRDLSFANNQLEGSIPSNLSSIHTEAFIGNKGLCGMPLNPCTLPPIGPSKGVPPNFLMPSPSPAPSQPMKKAISIIPIVVAAAIVLLVTLFVVALIIRRRNPPKQGNRLHGQAMSLPPNPTRDVEKGRNSDRNVTDNASKAKGDTGKLCFVREGGERFELSDLLKASAEILGSGCFGSSYKANLPSRSMMVVKRFKQMNNVGREDFHEHMRRLGRLEHHNLLSLVAYYYRREEKLLIYKFIEKGSLAIHLHGNQRENQPLDWPTRLKVIKGVAKGLSYLYKELPSMIAPHGHLKSSNVLLDESFNPTLNDHGLIPLINQENSQQLMVAYKSPEYITHSRISRKTDVWSLGILIIETITGEIPPNYFHQGNQVDLSSWVEEVVGDNIGRQIFDKNMGLTRNSEGEILKMLRIGLACCEGEVERRWDMKEAFDRIDEVKERDNNEDDFYSSYAASEGDRGSSSS